MPPPPGHSWDDFARNPVLHGPPEVDLTKRQQGDRLVAMTRNTCYEFEWLEGGKVLLKTDRTDRPWGQVTLEGCLFRQSGILAPGVAFQGGKLQYLTMQDQLKHQTTTVTTLALIRVGEAKGAAK